jgi:1,4-alpha-glucan branching enzyme
VREFNQYLEDEITRAHEDMALFHNDPLERSFLPLSFFWTEFYEGIKRDFNVKYDNDLIGAFKKLQDEGCLDIITCGATHGYFPLLGLDSSIQAQVKMAIRTHEKHFGRKPRGIWLPECAYRPRYFWKPMVSSDLGDVPYSRKGVEEILEENHLQYFIVDSSLVEGGKALGMYLGRFENLRKLIEQFGKDAPIRAIPDGPHSVYEVYHTRSSFESGSGSVAVFARDVETSMQVWSSEQGYPGGEWYLDFHKKHHQSGHRYWRVTSLNADLGLKTTYQPEKIEAALNEDADHFVASIRTALQNFKNSHGYEGTLTAPFDSELFGHWWFEGPAFLKKVFERLADNEDIHVTNCAQSVSDHPPEKTIAMPEGSWGAGGNHYVWMNHEVEWMWPYIYDNELDMRAAVKQWNRSSDSEWTAIIKQMARELFLLQASDWPFLVSTQSAIDYATERFLSHHDRFERLSSLAMKKSDGGYLTEEEKNWFATIQSQDYLFDDELIDPEWFLKD